MGSKVEFRPADAQSLPFESDSFDLVVCQFGLMFVPDKVAANSEARRVLPRRWPLPARHLGPHRA